MNTSHSSWRAFSQSLICPRIFARAATIGVAILGAGVASAQDRPEPQTPQQQQQAVTSAGNPKPAAPEIKIGSAIYRKLATREATEAAVLEQLFPSSAHWGGWYVATNFALEGGSQGKLAMPLPVEDELGKLAAGGPGLDLSRTFAGAGGIKVEWMPQGDISGRIVNFNAMSPKGAIDEAVAYAYAQVTCDADCSVGIAMGSDDGLRFWLNGKLLVDADERRGLTIGENKVTLDLKKGVNHLLAKIVQHKGDFAFRIDRRPPLDSYLDALIAYHLDVDFPTSPEARYYPVFTIPLPDEVVLEVGGLDVLPDGRPIVCTRRGDVWIIDHANDEPPVAPKFTLFATGLHEPLGLAVRREGVGDVEAQRVSVYCVQRGELTRLTDDDGDWKADRYETVNDSWGVSGNYHEFAFGPKFDREGNAWVTLNVGFCGSLGKAVAPYRGWAVKITPKGEMVPVCDGLRSPNGIGMFADGSIFYLDNQGDYVGTNRMSQLEPGAFMGHPAGLRWRTGRNPGDPEPPVQPATIWFPYQKLGQSAADFLYAPNTDDWRDARAGVNPAAGSFGPFNGQVFVGDQTHCLVTRVALEKVTGQEGRTLYQGAAFPFRKGLQCGVNRLAWGADGSMFIGQTDRGWGSIGRNRYGVERMKWSGEVPFEVLTMNATPDGFRLTFTKPVDPATASNPSSYAMTSYTYEYHAAYGSAEMDTKPCTVTPIVESPTVVRLKVDGLRSGGMGYVHELSMPGVRVAQAEDGGEKPGLLHTTAYYTLQAIPRP
ncbi:MAG: hypothetical protein SFY96_00025 [Planctomycetota bacterium]|nr:hypothetical protein [Planctomycetota bacterium]